MEDGPTGDASELVGAPKLYMEFEMTHLRFPLDEVFMKGGGNIQSAGARGSTLMMLTGSNTSVKTHLTETPSTVRIKVPEEEWSWDNHDVVTISNRMHLMLCTELNATPAVNVVLGESISGETGIKVASLFDREVDGKIVPAIGAAVTHYGAWVTGDNAYGFRHVRFVSGDGDEFVPHFQDDPEKNERMKSVSAMLQAKYDHAWQIREAVVLDELKNLTKPVSAVSFGLNASGYAPSFSVADREFPHTIEALEDLLKSAVTMDLVETKKIVEFCNLGSGMEAGKFTGNVVTAISLITNSLMPYRSDGSIMTMAGNQVMFKMAELWTNHSTNSPFRTDDCDGSAGKAVGIALAINKYAEGANPERFPFVVAAANALAHYTPAISVLAANAGQADDAREGASNIAGHAVAVFIHNVELLRGLHETATGTMQHHSKGTMKVSSATGDDGAASKLADTRLEAMYPPSLLSKLPLSESACIKEGWKSLYTSGMFESMPKFLVAEGTSPCASRLYTQDATERRERARESDASNEVLKSFAPSVARAFRWLDSSKTGAHKFYVKFAELALPPSVGLYTHPVLRSSADATAHIVLTERSTDGVIRKAGVTPKQLATGAFGAVPLYTLGEEEGILFDEAMEENKRNTMKAPGESFVLNDLQAVNLSVSLGAIEKLRDRIPREPTRSDLTEAAWLISFAALANNPHGVGVFLDELAEVEGLSGDIDIHPVRGLARHPQSGKELGGFVSLSLMVPSR